MTELYKRISQEKAKEMFETSDKYIILDVRTKEEYKEGHIKDAINIPNEDIFDDDILNEELDMPIFVYCRSGHRSLQASAKLALLGYTNIYEFGGINTWKYEIIK
ncbi:rhodanese-like domain-containing protein [Fusobacterium sp.]|uniref:rhodanese-like domain-containing protein n=1 Tax=Fusobacterium sp. TaxID=68766 RepID=UPI002605F950|nr:rhodanese-like domain-containing protein [Fusobacterium sp.]